jgi:ribosome-associated protein
MSTPPTTINAAETNSKQTQEEQARQFALDAAKLAANTRCHNVVVLDVRGISPVTDFMVLATGTSARQMKSVCEEIAEWAEQHRGQIPLSSDVPATTGGPNDSGGGWMLIDFVDVVVHVFSPDARAYYDLDALWGDAKLTAVAADAGGK